MGLNLLGKLGMGKGEKVRITNVNVYWKGRAHALKGMEVKKGSFNLEIPFSNKSEDLSFLKSAKEPPETISSIEVSSPFKLIGVSPQTPVSVEKGKSVTFIISIESPSYAYNGPLTVKFGSPAVPTIHLEIPKVILVTGKGQNVADDTGIVKNIEKGSTIEIPVQLYKGLSYGDSVSSVQVSSPFKLARTDPQLPIKIDDKNSYIARFYVTVPDFSYVGNLEITLS